MEEKPFAVNAPFARGANGLGLRDLLTETNGFQVTSQGQGAACHILQKSHGLALFPSTHPGTFLASSSP
jgi:hypothetical protein